MINTQKKMISILLFTQIVGGMIEITLRPY